MITRLVEKYTGKRKISRVKGVNTPSEIKEYDQLVQAACLVVCPIDQDSHFRAAHWAAEPLKFVEPAFIHSTFFPALQGVKSKMTASDPNSSIVLTDTSKQIEEKVVVSRDVLFTGCRETVDNHRAKGGNCNVAVSYQYLRFFMDDDDRLEQIRQDYSSGKMLPAELKNITIEVLQALVAQRQ